MSAKLQKFLQITIEVKENHNMPCIFREKEEYYILPLESYMNRKANTHL